MVKHSVSERTQDPASPSVGVAPHPGEEFAVRFVAEVSSNHHGSLERSLAFIETAARIGADAVKFQLFRVRELFAPEILAQSAVHRSREAWELPVEFLSPLAEAAHARGLQFSCTPFSLAAVTELEPHVDFFKIASYELLWDDLLSACAASRHPLVLSTGMATHDEVHHAVEVIAKAGCRDLTLLHCVSHYPTRPAEANLRALETLRGIAHSADFPGVRVGWSDHSVEPGVVQRAIHRFGAEMIEFHLDLDGQGEEFASGHCWLPGPMQELIRQVRLSQVADGHPDKGPTPDEMAERDWRADPSDGLRPLLATREAFEL